MTILGLHTDTWGIIGTLSTIVLSVVAIIIAIRSSRQTAKQTQQQVDEIRRLAELQIEATLLLLEGEWFKADSDFKKITTQAEIEGEMQSRNISSIEGVIHTRNAHKEKYSQILQGYQRRKDNLQRTINELKSKRK